MLGFRGAARYAHPAYAEGFALECAALRRVRGDMGLTNVRVMVPLLPARRGGPAGPCNDGRYRMNAGGFRHHPHSRRPRAGSRRRRNRRRYRIRGRRSPHVRYPGGFAYASLHGRAGDTQEGRNSRKPGHYHQRCSVLRPRKLGRARRRLHSDWANARFASTPFALVIIRQTYSRFSASLLVWQVLEARHVSSRPCLRNEKQENA